jgi:hypothetical protein
MARFFHLKFAVLAISARGGYNRDTVSRLILDIWNAFVYEIPENFRHLRPIDFRYFPLWNVGNICPIRRGDVYAR